MLLTRNSKEPSQTLPAATKDVEPLNYPKIEVSYGSDTSLSVIKLMLRAKGMKTRSKKPFKWYLGAR